MIPQYTGLEWEGSAMRFIQTHKQEAMVIGGVLTAAGVVFW